MLAEQVIYDCQTGETRIELVEVPDTKPEEMLPPPKTFEERLAIIEDETVKLVSTDLDFDFRLMEVEVVLQPMGLKIDLNRGAKMAARTPYEMMKILILANQYNKADMVIKMDKYLKYGRINKEQYDELMTLMKA